MKNFIILELLKFKPATKNLEWFYNILKNETIDKKIRKIIDKGFHNISPGSNIKQEEKAFFKCFHNVLRSKFQILLGQNEVKNLEIMSGENGDGTCITYKLWMGTRFLYFTDVTDIGSKLSIKGGCFDQH